MRRLAAVCAAGLVLVAALAPLLANDLPLLASVNGTLRFPAFESYLGSRPPAPAPPGWKAWAAAAEDGWAVMPPWPYGPDEVDLERRLAGPGLAHPMGNDDTGRDVLARIIHGTSLAMVVGLGAVVLGMLIGVPLGGWAGYRRGSADMVVSRLIEVFLCFPALFLVLAAAAFFGSSVSAVIVVLGAVYWTSFARIVRGEFLSLREREFVLAARGLGVGGSRLVLRHMLPSAAGPIAVTAAFGLAAAVVVESTLSFLGLGVASASWGGILAQGKEYAWRGAWHLWLFPGAMLVATVICLHGLADGFRRAR